MTAHPALDQRLRAAGLDVTEVDRAVRCALAEDLRYGPDVTTAATVGADEAGTAAVVPRQPGVLAGLPVALAVLSAAGIGPDAARALRADGERIRPGEPILVLHARLRDILGAERTMLNFLTHLSGIATATRAWVDAVSGTGCVIRDTRKTTPGLRELEKYAVRCGGGVNHRMGLGDAALIKDNHIAAAAASGLEPALAAAVHAVRSARPGLPLEVECDDLAQVRQALAAGATLILLDNMDLPGMREAVALRRAHPEVRLEASGGLRLESARAAAETGVDYLAVGALTHSSPALDIGLDVGLDAGPPGRHAAAGRLGGAVSGRSSASRATTRRAE